MGPLTPPSPPIFVKMEETSLFEGFSTPPGSQPGGSNGLITREHQDVLDIIDSLRCIGLERYVDLPQIIVCGDQSSGKSSVLEAISGLSFPAKQGVCTRFATELSLRPSPRSRVQVTIVAGHSRSAAERKALKSFSKRASTSPEDFDLGAVIRDAEKAMGLGDTNKRFSNDTLKVEISAPNLSRLTLVDLPGLFVAGDKRQSVEDAQIVRELVMSYMEKPRSIILAVVSANVQFTLQSVTERARQVDPEGARTLGLITKPDKLDHACEDEQTYITLAENKDVNLRLGWHVVKNRDWKERDMTAEQRDGSERQFFEERNWNRLDPEQLGVAHLVARLSKVLRQHIVSQLPQLLDEICKRIDAVKSQLAGLGDTRTTVNEQRRYLCHVSEAFSRLVKAAVDGDYTNRSFFPNEGKDENRLRARVASHLTAFAESMQKRGHSHEIFDEEDPTASLLMQKHKDGVPPTVDGPAAIPRGEYILHVQTVLSKGKGRELPCTYNPQVIGDLFGDQCKPWNAMARGVMRTI
ncbi:interferon-induced GTP-binding protein Mx [Emericellopsis atlantica]|uniref:Interferon-induced GTP-binding protein Mx n=1 Tax=Emericellopsis atlantica TaxID=2614577 RepID=A0A9P7ZC96_9HYPO|nr:interferon-induced GTP-binding protein Mx [Emericellopsis atlantica]KAG9249424.1 interferon-induced GTP-binding protein Mx [Emericellopsis atlantica]